MAGYTLKIVIEDTHPPVWRRIIVPDKITFYDLHRLIQMLFNWDDGHLHEFSIPKDYITISDDAEFSPGRHYMEEETLIDPFVREYKWIRYTYDFGDDWRHKIICEKRNPEYDQRTAQLLKWKGDHFCEDSGGVYGSETRIPFLLADVGAGLENYMMPVNPDLEEPKIFRETMNQITEMFQKLFRRPTKASEMEEMAEEWNAFANEVNGQKVKLEAGKKTNRECLEKLGANNAMDYCKYLQLVIDQRATQKQRLDAIAQCFQEYPEYFLYVLNQEDYQKLQKLSKISVGTELQTEEYDICISKAITLGLCEFHSAGSKKEIRLAVDLGVIFQNLDRKKARQTHHMIEQFDQRFGDIMCMYGFVELESAFQMYQKYYNTDLKRESFYRMVYWHASLQRFVITGIRQEDGKAFVSMADLDLEKITELQLKYAEDLPYAMFPLTELQEKAADLGQRNEWISMIAVLLRYEFNYEEGFIEYFMQRLVTDVMNGASLNEILEKVDESQKDIVTDSEMWKCMSGILLELELPMLKGRSRETYAEEKGVSPWQIGMVTKISEKNTKERKMCEFPSEIQQMMHEACSFGMEESRKKLIKYQKQETICSEEFLYLLADCCIQCGEFEQAKYLTGLLKKSSMYGKKAAQRLTDNIEDGQNVTDDWEENSMDSGWIWDEDFLASQQPYVRQNSKIGRNDPCPCGSGKKYKKCCGK